MPQDERLTGKRLDALLRAEDQPVIPLEERIAVISDLHMGNGGWADNFRGNEPALLRALASYREEGRILVLLGDIEELWQFDLEEIRDERRAIYDAIGAFGRRRLIRVWGNHDDLWSGSSLEDPTGAESASEALRVETGGRQLLLVHGHQGSLESDAMGAVSRLLVRLFRYVEGPWILLLKALRLYRKPSTISRIPRNYERVMHGWALSRDTVLICGHSHRAVFASLTWAQRLRAHCRRLAAGLARAPRGTPRAAELRLALRRARRELRHERRQGRDVAAAGGTDVAPMYFNCGCGLYREGMTALELGHDGLRLVKWGSGATEREVYHDMPLERILQATAGSMQSDWLMQ